MWLPIAMCCGFMLSFNEPLGQKLMTALQEKNYEAVAFLLKQGADVNVVNEAGLTPLHLVAINPDLFLATTLLAAGAKVNQKTQSGLQATPLMLATSASSIKLGTLLIENGAAVNLPDRNGDHALNWAAYQGSITYTRFLMKNGGDVWLKSRHGRPLDIAMRRGHEDLLHDLADAMDLPAAQQEHAAVLEMVVRGHFATLKIVLQSQEDWDLQDRFGRSLLSLAIIGGQQKMAMYLLEKGANTRTADRIGFTPLMYAARDGQVEIVAPLVANGSQINQVSRDTGRNLTALSLAVIGGHQRLAAMLLKQGAQIDLADTSGNTVLHLAVGWRRKGLVKLLLNYDADPEVTNKDGLSAVMLAKQSGLKDIEKLLQNP